MIAYMKKTISKVAAAIVVAVLSSAILTSCDPEKGDKTIAVSGVSINKTSINLAEGDSETLTATLSPAEATNKSVSWSSSDIGVAFVDYSGKVTGVKAGSATITVTTADGSKTATCSVTVSTVALAKITVSPAEKEVTIGTPATLSVQYTPENASNKRVTWKSSDEATAKVSSSGIVEGVKEGTATITATSEDGGFKATCKVNVTSLMKAGVYWLQDDMIHKDGKSLGIKTYINPCIDLDGAIYYHSDDNVHVHGVPSYKCDIQSSWDNTAAGGGYFFVDNRDENSTSLSILKIDPKKRTTKKIKISESTQKGAIWVYDMAADSKGNLYVAGETRKDESTTLATLWKVDASDKVTTTYYSDGTGFIKNGPAVDAVAVNKNGDVFCLVFEGGYNSKYAYEINLYKNGTKQYMVTNNCSRTSTYKCDIAVNGNDVYMAICEYDGDKSSCVKVYKNKNVIYTLKDDDLTYAGNIAVTSKGDVYCDSRYSAGSEKHTIWKNGEKAFSVNNDITFNSFFVKE
jgi:uncharacterized protein YjdB